MYDKMLFVYTKPFNEDFDVTILCDSNLTMYSDITIESGYRTAILVAKHNR